MFEREDNTYNDMRESSMNQWLQDLVNGDDFVNQSGARLTLNYIEHLNQRIKELEVSNELKNQFLKKMKNK